MCLLIGAMAELCKAQILSVWRRILCKKDGKKIHEVKENSGDFEFWTPTQSRKQDEPTVLNAVDRSRKYGEQ
jgi:hypothetical protein